MTKRLLALLGSVAVLGFSVAPATMAQVRPTPFPGDGLLPGDTASTSITVAATGRAHDVEVQATQVRQRCADPNCPAHPGTLADMLVISLRDASGDGWTGTLADLAAGITLPHSSLPPGHARRYGLSLTLPASVDDSVEGLAFSANVALTARDANGQAVGSSAGRTLGTGVLGEKLTRASGATRNGVAQGYADDSLPFTGYDAVLALLVAGALIAAGVSSVTAARSRRM